MDNILGNMDDTGLAVKLAYAFITAHVVLAYPIPLNPVSLQIERMLGIDKQVGRRELISRIFTRTLLVLLSVFIASVVPYFGDILQLVSALSIVVVAFVFPPWFYYLLYRHRGLAWSQIILMSSIAVLGIAASVVGVYFAIKGLIHDIQTLPNQFNHYF
jgi:amino acid permease